MPADGTKPDDAKRLAAELDSSHRQIRLSGILPTALRSVLVCGGDFSGEGEQQTERMFRHSLGVSSWSINYEDSRFRCSVNINRVGRGSTNPDESQAGRFFDSLVEHEVGLDHEHVNLFSD